LIGCFSRSFDAIIEKRKANITENGVFMMRDVVLKLTPYAIKAATSVIATNIPIRRTGMMCLTSRVCMSLRNSGMVGTNSKTVIIFTHNKEVQTLSVTKDILINAL